MNQTHIALPPRSKGLAWGVLLSSLLLVLMAWNFMREQDAQNAERQFELFSKEIVDAIAKRLRDHEQILLGGAGLFDASGHVTRSEWRAYVERLRLEKNYPGIQGVGFSQVIAPANVQAHIAQIRAEGFPDYAIKPVGERSFYTSIVYLEPFSGRNLAAFGYDMFSQETRRKAMQRAVDSGETAISEKVTLVQETHGNPQAGFLMYVPVYRPGLPIATTAERWRALMGFVYSPYRVDDLMQGILAERNTVLDFSIHDGIEINDKTRMYDSLQIRSRSGKLKSRFTESRRIEAYGLTWTITLSSRPEFEAQFSDIRESLILVLGIGISLSLFALTWTLLTRREQALVLANEMTAKRQESEARFHQLFLHLGQGVIIHQADGQISDANPAAEEILGWDSSEENFCQVPFWQAIREDGSDFPSREHPAMVALQEGRAVTGAVMGVFRPSTSDWRWIMVDAYPRLDPGSGRIQQIYSVISDITAMRTADQEIRQAQKFLTDVLTAASEVSIIATDRDGLITVFNRGAERMLGYDAAEVVGRQTPAIIHVPEEVSARGEELSRIRGHEVQGFRVFVEIPEQVGAERREWTYVHKDGHHFPVLLTVTTMRDDDGNPMGYLGIAEDITDRRQAAAALQEQAMHTQAILDNMVDGLITIDQSGLIQSYTPSSERIFGYAAAEVMGKNVNMLMPSPHREAHDSYLRNYRATGVARIIGIGREVEGLRKDGSLFPMDLAVSEITHQGKPIYVGMVRDITERKRMERMKNEFVSTVSHELRTPLTAISGALGLLTGGALGELPAQARQMIVIAHKNSLRLTHLINDLLDIEKIAAGKLHFDMQPQALGPLIQQAIEANRAYGSERRVALVLDEPIPEVEVRVDSLRLMQILSNLLSNAIKFSPEDGTVDVRVEEQNQSVRVTVIDHGPGIPAEFRTRIFQKFAQADASDTRQKGGTGLGLAITRELIERMGGRIDFESEEGKGSRFYFELPQWRANGGKLLEDAGMTSEGLRILVVEDDPDIAGLLALMLSRAGYGVDIAANGGEALALLQDKAYAAMTLDLMLPDMSGLAIIHHVRQRQSTADLPIVVVSAKVEEGRLAINGDFSRIDWLPKPIDETRLMGLLERQLQNACDRQQRPKVLHVEDDEDLHQVVLAMVGGRFDFQLATSLQQARESILSGSFDVVILDLSLPDGSGWELLPEIRVSQPEARVIILSGADLMPEDSHKVEAVLLKSRVSPRELLDALSAGIKNKEASV